MFNRIKNYLILPSVIILIAIYILGLTIVRNRSFIDLPAQTASAEVYGESNTDTDSDSDKTDYMNKNDSNAKINLNTASEDDLQKIKGIGPKTAERIIKYREEIGGYKKTEQLMEVEGIGEKMYANIEQHLTIE